MSAKSKGNLTRELIINKATILFTRNGYNRTSLSDILVATGLTKGGFYFHFRSKEELGAAVIDTLELYWRDVLLPSMAQGKDAVEKINILLSSRGDCDNTPDCIRPTILLLNLATEMMEVHDCFSKRLRAIFTEWWHKLEEVIEEGKKDGLFREGICTNSVAAIILSNIMGANLLAVLNDNPKIYRQQLASLQQILLTGIAIK